MDYYRNSVTEKSWHFLLQLAQKISFVLIGGWAVWLYARQLKSKDIDIVVEHTSLEQLKHTYDIVKNERLQKYEVRQGEVDVDIYAPYYSTPGIRAELILADSRTVDGFLLPSRELLFVTKTAAWYARRASPKGRKDFLDIVSILELPGLDTRRLNHWFGLAQQQGLSKVLTDELKRTTSVAELQLSVHKIARAKKRWLAHFL